MGTWSIIIERCPSTGHYDISVDGKHWAGESSLADAVALVAGEFAPDYLDGVCEGAAEVAEAESGALRGRIAAIANDMVPGALVTLSRSEVLALLLDPSTETDGE